MIPDNLAYLVATGAAASGSTTLVVNVGDGGGSTVLPGERVFVGGGGGTAAPTGVTDTQGNAYTLVQSNVTSPAAWQFVAVAGTHGLRTDGQGAAAPGGSPDQITLTYSGTGSAKQVVVFAVAGPYTGCIGAAGPVDTGANVTAAGTSAAPTVTSGTLAGTTPGELVVATLTSANGGGAPAWGSNWFPLGTAQTGAGSYCSTAVWTPNVPNVANTHPGTTTAITANATLSSSQAWTMCITAIKPGSNTVKSWVGATIFHPAYPTVPSPSSPPGQGDVNATLKFNQITGTAAGLNGRKTYHTTGLWAVDVTHPRPWGTYIVNGMYQFLCIKPLPAVGGGVPSEKTNMASFLALMKNYVCQVNTNAVPAGGLGVILWQEPNLGGKGGAFGDGSSTPLGAGSTPYWSPGQPPVTEPQAASNYQDYAQYYTGTAFAAGLPVAYDPVVSSPSTGVDWFPGRRWCSAYVWDYYFHADWAAPTQKGKGDDQHQFIAQAGAQTPPLAIGVAEIGPNDSHAPNNTPADIWYAGYFGWMRDVVVAPILAYIAAGGYMAPSAGAFEDQQGVGNLNPGPPENTPRTILDSWVYFYNQLSLATGGSPVVVTASPLPDGLVGAAYTGVSLIASGGTPALTGGGGGYTWAVTSGQLPPGMTLSTGGTLAGTPTAAMTRTPTFTVTDSVGATGSAVLSITVDPNTLTIPAQSLPGGTVGSTYAGAVTATSGTKPYTWALTSGTLPTGLTLATTGTIGGTPSAAGTSTFTLTVTDHVGATAAASFSIKIVATGALTVLTTTLPDATAGSPYTTPLGAVGGTPPYTWAVTVGTLPPGITLAGSTLTGTPLAETLGTTLYPFTIQVTDSLSATASALVSITLHTVIPAPAVKGPWRILYASVQPDGTILGEVLQAQNKTVTLRAETGQNHEVSFDIDGHSPDAANIVELQTDIQVMFGPQLVFCGRVVPTQDTLTAVSHRTVFTALDYREVLRRRCILPSDTISWTSTEQATIAWNLIQGTQARSGGNLGIARGRGQNTGTQRTVTFALGDYIADDIDAMASSNNGFEWDITPYGSADLRLDVWSPARGADGGLVLAWGDARISSITRTVDPSTYANAAYVIGASGSGSPPWPNEAPSIGTRPEGRWDLLVSTNLKTPSFLQDYATQTLAHAEVLVPSYQVVFYPGAWAGPNDIWIGDTVTLQIDSGRLQVNEQLRVMELSFAINPDNLEVLTATIGIIPQRWWKTIPAILRNIKYLTAR